MEEMMCHGRARNELLAKYLWPLFLLRIPNIIADLMTGQLSNHFPALSIPGSILQLLCFAVYTFLLLQLAPTSQHFKQAGMSRAALLALDLISLVVIYIDLAAAVLAALLSLVMVVLNLYSVYHEFMGYAEVLTGVDDEQAQKWKSLWTLNLVAIVGTFVCIFLALIPILGLFFVLALVVFALVVDILELVYLYRAAQLFRKLASE